MTDINYDEIAEAPITISDGELKSIALLAERQMIIEDWILAQSERLKEAGKNLAKIMCEELPAAMKEAGLKTFALDNGCEIELSAELKTSITEKNKPWCHNWLRENKHGDLIKNEFKTVFGMGEGEKAKALAEFLMKEDQSFTQKEAVHAQTLGAFVRSELKVSDHNEEWEKAFGVFRWKQTKITRPKT